MKFVCDSCHAQYMISDDKVGANGVKVRCKKCSNIIVVKKVVEPDPTVVMQNPLANAATNAGDAPFGGLDMDEIGQAFDSVLSSGPHKRPDSGGGEEMTNPGTPVGSGSNGFPMAAAGAAPDEHESTRVMDVRTMAGLAAETEERTALNDIPDAIKAQGYVDAKPKNEANGHSNGANGTNGTNGIPQTDWYAAINDEQQGPMTLDVIKGHWEAGRITSDSLVWRTGYGDWRPLSTVADLVKVLTPLPTPRKAPEKASEVQPPAGATASGPQLSAVAPAPAAVPDPDEVDWKPAAASALASLVAEEMEALSKPAPKKRDEPVGVGETTGLKPILPVLEAAAPAAPEPAPAPAPVASQPRLPEREPEPQVIARPQPAPSPYPSAPEVPVYPAPAAYVPPAPSSGNTKYIVAGGGVVVFCLTAIAIAFLFTRQPTPVAPQPVQVADARPAAQPVAAQPAPQPVAAQPAPQPVAAQPAPTQPAPQPAAPQPVAQPTPAQPTAAAKAETTPEQREKMKAWAEKHGAKSGKHEKSVAEAAPEPAPESHKSQVSAPASDGDLLGAGNGSKVDRDFESLLGNGEKKAEAPKDSGKKKAGNDVYIPPAMNNLPEQLTPGDVMGVVAGHKAQIKGCIDKQRAKDPDAAGSLKVHWVIQKNGSVNGVSAPSDEFPVMASCMSGQVKTWKFPQFSGAPMPIDFPFKF
jgi:predicted Zn finger-like uncharacterized protein